MPDLTPTDLDRLEALAMHYDLRGISSSDVFTLVAGYRRMLALEGIADVARRSYDKTLRRTCVRVQHLRSPVPDPAPVHEFLTVQETAAELRCSVASVNRLISRGELPSIKAGGLRRVRRSVLATWPEPKSPGDAA